MKTRALLLAFGLAACAKSDKPAASGAGKSLTIAVVPKGTTHEFWRSIHAGAVQAAQEFSATGHSVHIIWKGPLREHDPEQQIPVIEGFLSQRVQGIVLAPPDRRAL